MKTLSFRTNAKCAGCVAKIDAELGKLLPAGSWSFDLSSPGKTLAVTAENISARQIVEAVAAAGYKAEEEKA